MITQGRLLRETYGAYLEGHVDFDEVKRVTEAAVEEYERSRHRGATEHRGPTAPQTAQED